MKLKVFIGSSAEALEKAKAIQDLLFEESGSDEIKVLGWWHNGCFPVGTPFIEALDDAIHECNCAILLAAEEDKVTKRGEARFEPRNNIILEYGMFSGAYGRGRTALAVVNDPRLPSDLEGVMHLTLHTSPDNSFEEINRGRIRRWIAQVRKCLQECPPSLEESLPLINRRVIDLLKRQDRSKVDELVSDLLEVVASSMQSDYNYNAMSVQFLRQKLLHDCRSIFAVDVLGPRAWITPTAYLYLAVQIRQYLRVNATADGFDLRVDKSLHDSIDRAIDLAKSHGLEDSRTYFDPEDPLRWSEGDPKLQYARVLLWSREELLSPLAESVLAIHQAFHVPLFFKETPLDDAMRRRDFILFEKRSGRVEGFVNIRNNAYEFPDLSLIEGGRLPGGVMAIDYFRHLLAQGLLFAVDQRAIWRQ